MDIDRSTELKPSSCCLFFYLGYSFYNLWCEVVTMDTEPEKKPAEATADPKEEPLDMAQSTSGTNTPGRNVKPALKKDASGDAANQKKDKHLKWDEKAIEEHDQLRGTRMKIDEPNTPFANYDSGAESDDSRRPKSPANQKPTLSWDLLQTKLDSVAAVREAYPSSPSSHAETDHSDVEEERKKEMRALEFKEHRKRHYNEMEAVRKFRQEHPDGLEAEEDQDGDADVEEGNSNDD